MIAGRLYGRPGIGTGADGIYTEPGSSCRKGSGLPAGLRAAPDAANGKMKNAAEEPRKR